jgi:hypothetical protein
MTFATHYSPAGRRANTANQLNPVALALVALFLLGFSMPARSENATNATALRAKTAFQALQETHQASRTNTEVAWQFARACFDWAEFATNDAQRAQLAQLGIKASRAVLAKNSNSLEGHYYLGMNLGQLARTKSLGALPIVDEMEIEFKAARALDEKFDHAGPVRNLGLLYLDAPSFGSIGSRSKARTHLQRAAELAPDFPENRLNLAEARVRWRDLEGARRELEALEAGQVQARENFAGDAWAAAWADWELRLQKLRARLQAASKPVTSPKGAAQ